MGSCERTMFRFVLRFLGLFELSLDTDQRDLAVVGALLVIGVLLAALIAVVLMTA